MVLTPQYFTVFRIYVNENLHEDDYSNWDAVDDLAEEFVTTLTDDEKNTILNDYGGTAGIHAELMDTDNDIEGDDIDRLIRALLMSSRWYL